MSRQIRLHYHNDRILWRVDSPDVPGLHGTAKSLHELRLVASRAIEPLQNGSIEIIQHIVADPVLQAEIEAPRHRGSLDYPDIRVIVQDEAGGNVLRVAVKTNGFHISEAAFLSFGEPVLTACCSFVLDAVVGRSLRFAAHLRAAAVVHVLALDDEKAWCVELVLEAIRKIIEEILARRQKRRRRPAERPPGGPCGHHQPKPQRSDGKLLRPGETLHDLMVELGSIVGAIENLGRLLEIGTAARSIHADTVSDEREALLCLLADLKKTIPLLSAADQRLITLIGLDGLTQGEAAAAMGTSQPAVHKRLWVTARRIQRIWRKR